MKKTSSKSPKLSTPTPVAAKLLPVAAPKVAAAASAKPVRVELPKKAVAPVQAKKPVTKSEAPVVVASKVSAPAKAGKSVIQAKIDIGFGNSLFIRGEGAGLSWDKGTVMDNVSADEWRIELSGSKTPVVFKFLVNDLTWSAGEDYTVAAGETVLLVPAF